MTLEDLKKSITELPTDDLIELLRARRLVRRSPSDKPKKSTKKVDPFSNLTPEMAAKLLAMLGDSNE